MTNPTHKINVTFEITSTVTSEHLHEDLCKAIHEGDIAGLQNLTTYVSNIDLTDEPLTRFSDLDRIAYSLIVHMEAESDDTSIHAFMQAEPECLRLDAVSFAQAYLAWAEGPNWFMTARADEYLDSNSK